MSTSSHAVAIFYGPKVKGEVYFEQPKNKSGTYVTFNLKGLGKNKTRAVHIHTYGDLRKGCKSLGSHWNPKKKLHGSYYFNGLNHHSGDLINNMKANTKGTFKYKYFDPLVKLRGMNNIYGRSVVVHDGVDDLGQGGDAESKKTGNAGGRMACAIIVHYQK